MRTNSLKSWATNCGPLIAARRVSFSCLSFSAPHLIGLGLAREKCTLGREEGGLLCQSEASRGTAVARVVQGPAPRLPFVGRPLRLEHHVLDPSRVELCLHRLDSRGKAFLSSAGASQSKRTLALKVSRSLNAPLYEVAGSNPLKGGPLNEPMYENVSRWLGAIWSVCIPPIERPAIARWVRFAIVR